MEKINVAGAGEKAVEYFNASWNCAESVYMAIHDQFGEGEAPIQLITCLGGGMGCKKTCGALTGAIVGLGLVFGRKSPDKAAKETAYAKAKALCDAFRESCHSTECWELTQCETDAEKKKQLCLPLVRKAAELATALMAGQDV